LINEGWVDVVDVLDLPSAMQTDKRSFGVRLSPAGERKWKAARPHWRKAQEEIGAILGDGNLRQLIDLVDDANLKFEYLDKAEQ
jgi:DNA-binding MarR family transcriptional regulator